MVEHRGAKQSHRRLPGVAITRNADRLSIYFPRASVGAVRLAVFLAPLLLLSAVAFLVGVRLHLPPIADWATRGILAACAIALIPRLFLGALRTTWLRLDASSWQLVHGALRWSWRRAGGPLHELSGVREKDFGKGLTGLALVRAGKRDLAFGRPMPEGQRQQLAQELESWLASAARPGSARR